MTEEVATLRVSQARTEERVSALEEWQVKQNGTLQKLDGKMDRHNQWLIGLMGGVIASLILLVVNLTMGR